VTAATEELLNEPMRPEKLSGTTFAIKALTFGNVQMLDANSTQLQFVTPCST
jgi:hypothetical protein